MDDNENATPCAEPFAFGNSSPKASTCVQFEANASSEKAISKTSFDM
jgi:hypothetical protein